MPYKGACLDHEGEYGWLHMSLGTWCEVFRLGGRVCRYGFEVGGVAVAVAVAVGVAGPVGSVAVAAVVGVAVLGIVYAAASAGVAVVVVAVAVVAAAVVVVAVAGAAAAGVVVLWMGTSGVVGLRRNRRMRSACPSLCVPSEIAGIAQLYGPSSRWC